MSKLWKKTISNQNDNISQILKKISDGNMGISFVLDDNQKLRGTVTDGDIRRALIKGLGLDTKVKKIMNKNWKSVSDKDDTTKILSIMNKYELLQIPILDSSNRIKDVYFISKLTKKIKYENIIFLMAGGFGKRLLPITKKIPKPMLKVKGKPILENIIDRCSKFGFENFVISTHYKSNFIKNHFKDGKKLNVNIKYIREKTPLGTAGSLSLIKNQNLQLPIIIINGDLVSEINYLDLLNSHNSSNCEMTIGVAKYNYSIPYGEVEMKSNKVIQINEKPNFEHNVNAGIYVINPSILKKVKKNKFLSMTDLISILIKDKIKINPFLIFETWKDIGTFNELRNV